MKDFESFLAPRLREYMTYRQNLGYSKDPTMSHLMIFDRYLTEHRTDQGAVSEALFFLELRRGLSIEPRSVNRVLSSVCMFFQFMVRRGYYTKNPVRDVPRLSESMIIAFVFSPQQVDELLSAVCKRLRKNPKYFPIDLAIYTAIVLMARCAMRIKEPLRLLRNHYQPEDKTLYIEKTKFKKDRLIPVPESVAVGIENYLAVRDAFLRDDRNPYLLANRDQRPLSDFQVRRRFHQAVRDIGLNRPRRVMGNMNFSAPTPHSLRHSFAIHTLRRIKERGGSPQNAFPVLAAYMGHSEYRHTIEYLRFVDAGQREGLANFVSSHLGPR